MKIVLWPKFYTSSARPLKYMKNRRILSSMEIGNFNEFKIRLLWNINDDKIT